MKRIIPISILIVSLWLLISGLTNDNRGDISSVVTEIYNDKPVLRATLYYEKCFAVCGAIYVFESFKDGSWTEITSFRHDDPDTVPAKNLRVENESLMYFWFAQTYSVSTDGGETWSVWNVKENNLENKAVTHSLIEEVRVKPDGKGRMFFKNSGDQKGKDIYLVTENFGKTWDNENK